MAKRSLIDQLDQAVETILAHPDSPLPPADARLALLLRIAADLRDLPSEDFRARLKAHLQTRGRMISKPKPVPKGYLAATPYLCVRNAASAIEFYKKVFGAAEVMRLAEPSGRIGHAEIRIKNAAIMLADEFPELGILSPESLGGSRPPVIIHLYVEDVDTVYQRALQAGATSLREPADQFYGDRNAQVKDPFGHVWYLSTHKEDVAPDEVRKRFDALTMQQRPVEKEVPMPVKPIREGFRTVTPYLVVQEPGRLLDFVKQAFGAEETLRTTGPAGGMHAEVRIGDSMVMLGGGAGFPPMPAMLLLYVNDVDNVYQLALQAGATSLEAPANQAYGDRRAGVKDPFGNYWYMTTHIKDLPM